MILTLNSHNSSDNVFGVLKPSAATHRRLFLDMPTTSDHAEASDRLNRQVSDSPPEEDILAAAKRNFVSKRNIHKKRDRSNDILDDDAKLKKKSKHADNEIIESPSDLDVLSVSQKRKQACSSSQAFSLSWKSQCTLSRLNFVLLQGRGGGTNLHPGNRFYRDLILSHRAVYDESSKTVKPDISRQIVHAIHQRGGRFLSKEKDGKYREIGEVEAKAKTSQALRHRTFELRNTQNPDRVKMNGRWKPNESDCGKSTSSTNDKSSAGGVHMLPSMVANVQNGFADTPTASRSLIGDSATSAFATDRALLHERIRRQQLLEATAMNTSSSSGGTNDDAAYISAIANLRHQEAMLNIDRALHQAEKRRYQSIGYPGQLTSSFSAGLPAASSVSSLHHPLLLHGNVSRGLSLGNSSATLGSILGTGLHEHARLHSQFGGPTSPLKGDLRDRLTIQPYLYPGQDVPYSSASMTSQSRERLAEMEKLLQSSRARSIGGHTMHGNGNHHPKSPSR